MEKYVSSRQRNSARFFGEIMPKMMKDLGITEVNAWCYKCNASTYKRLGTGQFEGWVIWICSECGDVVKKVRAG